MKWLSKTTPTSCNQPICAPTTRRRADLDRMSVQYASVDMRWSQRTCLQGRATGG